ncbi:aminotransferase class V-fold PLP-dependent enzyme [Nocardia takedensis]
MPPRTSLAPREFAPETVYLNTAALGLPAARSLAAVEEVNARWVAGRHDPRAADRHVEPLRAGFARLLAGARPEDIALGATVAGLIGPVVASLPAGAEVLLAENEFSSVSSPFHYRGDLAVRYVPLTELAERVRPQTALVAVSAVQSADGRVADLAALRAATLAHGADLLVDATQAAGWLPLRLADADYWVCATYKWLLGARSVAFFAVAPAAAHRLRPVSPGWYAAADRWTELYGPVALADSARRLDASPDWAGVVAAQQGLLLLEEIGVDAVRAHDLALAERLRAGAADLGYTPVPGPSAIVSIPGADAAGERLARAEVMVSTRGGALRAAFHLYNGDADVDRALDALGPVNRAG